VDLKMFVDKNGLLNKHLKMFIKMLDSVYLQYKRNHSLQNKKVRGIIKHSSH